MNPTNYPLNAGRLSRENLRRKPARTASLIVVVAILSFTLFAGSILASSLENGLERMSRRFGADIMVVPAGYGDKAEGVLLRGEPSNFYFGGNLVSQIQGTDGILQATPQFFLASLSAECCDVPVQLIAFDPATDFVITPWIKEERGSGIERGQLVVGSRILVDSDNTIKLFNRKYPVVAQLSKTATGFDSSVFMDWETMDALRAHAHQDKYRFLADYESEGAISAIMARVDVNGNAESIARSIKWKNKNVDVLVSQGILASLSVALRNIVNYISGFSVILWILAVVVLASVFSGSINERKKEFAILRILGASRKKLLLIITGESALIGLAGSAVGIALASLLFFPFNTYIGQRLQLPFIKPVLGNVLAIILVSFALSFAAGPLAALYATSKIGRAETYFTMREGE
jgi:putative ABC transport system permease protein